MRSIIPVILVASLAGPLGAAIEWEQQSLTINAEPFDEEATGVFTFTNTGSEPIMISEVHSSCGCTVPELEKKSYAPGEKGQLRAVFSFGGREGRQVKTISVTTDDPQSRFHDLTLTVNIPQIFEVSPRYVMWRKGQPAEAKTVSIRVLIPDLLQLTDVTCRDERFVAELAANPEAPGAHLLTITPRHTEEGAQATVIVNTNAPADEPRVITIYALVR